MKCNKQHPLKMNTEDSLFKPMNITFPFDGTDLQHLNKTHIHLVNIEVYLFILLQNITLLFCG